MKGLIDMTEAEAWLALACQCLRAGPNRPVDLRPTAYTHVHDVSDRVCDYIRETFGVMPDDVHDAACSVLQGASRPYVTRVGDEVIAYSCDTGDVVGTVDELFGPPGILQGSAWVRIRTPTFEGRIARPLRSLKKSVKQPVVVSSCDGYVETLTTTISAATSTTVTLPPPPPANDLPSLLAVGQMPA